MKVKTAIVGLASVAATGWVVDRVRRGLGLPVEATGLVTLAVSPYVHKAVRRII